MTEAPALAIFARAPVPGCSKTRLIPRLGADGAARLHEAMVRHAIQTALTAELGPATLFCAPDAKHEFFAGCARDYGVSLADQSEGDLGQRMLAAFEALAPNSVILIGTDLPVLTAPLLREAAVALAQYDAVFLPTEDGGYGLIGLRLPQPAVFKDIAWSTPSAMSDTRERLRHAGLSWNEPAIIWDVDRSDDVDRLIAERLLPGWNPGTSE